MDFDDDRNLAEVASAVFAKPAFAEGAPGSRFVAADAVIAQAIGSSGAAAAADAAGAGAGAAGSGAGAGAGAGAAGAAGGAGAGGAAGGEAGEQDGSGIPETVKAVLGYFASLVKDGAVYEIHQVYDHTWNRLTEKHYSNSRWPAPDTVAPLMGSDDPLVLNLYKELYYRHIFANLTPTAEERGESWKNYLELFGSLLSATTVPRLDLPHQWLWDMIDEFVYQWVATSQWRARVARGASSSPSEDAAWMEANPAVWATTKVLATLHGLADKARTIEVLKGEKAGSVPPAPAGTVDFAQANLYRMLGHFSLVGLLRVHCVLSDFRLALQSIEAIDVGKKGLFARVTACHITLYYYMGFAYMMMRRYVDATRCFAGILVYINRTKQFHTRSYQYDTILKKTEQMHALLAICLCLSPQRVDEVVHAALREKYGEKMARMSRGELPIFEELFTAACPKFVSPVVQTGAAQGAGPFAAVVSLFMDEVGQQVLIPTIRSYLKLYTTISISKLATFLGVTAEQLRGYLLRYKHKTRSVVWTAGGPALGGQAQSASDVAFYVDKDLVCVAETKVERRFGDFFMRHISKFEEMITDIETGKIGTGDSSGSKNPGGKYKGKGAKAGGKDNKGR